MFVINCCKLGFQGGYLLLCHYGEAETKSFQRKVSKKERKRHTHGQEPTKEKRKSILDPLRH